MSASAVPHCGLREDFESIKYRCKDQKVRNKTKENKKDPLEVASYNKPWWLKAYSLPGTPWDRP